MYQYTDSNAEEEYHQDEMLKKETKEKNGKVTSHEEILDLLCTNHKTLLKM